MTLTDDQRAFLAEPRFAVLATINRDGTPQQSTVWYDLDGDEIVLNTRRGRLKDRNLRRDPRASLCVEDGYRYLTVRGSVTLDEEETTAQADIRRLAVRYDGPEEAERQMREEYSRQERVTVRLRIERVHEYGLEAGES
jgi:PPOX class probable F420-dependent enzyme